MRCLSSLPANDWILEFTRNYLAEYYSKEIYQVLRVKLNTLLVKSSPVQVDVSLGIEIPDLESVSSVLGQYWLRTAQPGIEDLVLLPKS